MEQAVEQHRLESKIFEVKMNQVLNENKRLLEQVICKDIVNSFVDNTYENVHECGKCLKLETELQKDFIEKEIYNKLFKSYTTLEKHCISLEVDTQLNQEIFQRDNSVSNQSAPSFDQLFGLNELKAQTQEKDIVIKKLKERIKSLRLVHSDYLKHTQEEAAILKEIVEEGKSQNPLNTSLESACKYTKQIQELLILIGQTCPSFNNSSAKLMAVIPKNKDKRVRFTEPVTSSRNTNTKTASTSNLVSNKPMLSSIGVIRSGLSDQKDRKPSQNDKTEHGMEKTVQNHGQSPKMSKSESILKNQQSNRSRN
ncbi:hypothetical protein Tco_1313286 [Tanacetum coccineum]